MSILQVSVTALLLGFLFFGMRESGIKGAGAILLFAGVWAVFPLVDRLLLLVQDFRMMAEGSQAAPLVEAMLKLLGVGYLVHIAAECCRESGAASLASKVELCGKLEMLVICLPYIHELLSYATDLVGQSS